MLRQASKNKAAYRKLQRMTPAMSSPLRRPQSKERCQTLQELQELRSALRKIRELTSQQIKSEADEKYLPPKPLPQPSHRDLEADYQDEWDRLKRVTNKLAIERGHYSGYPMPIADFPLQLCRSFPFPKLDGMSLNDEEEEDKKTEELLSHLPEERRQQIVAAFRGLAEHVQVKLVNAWTMQDGRKVLIVRTPEGKSRCMVYRKDRPQELLAMTVNTACASQVHSLETERRALLKLRDLVSPHIYETYVLTGAFPETSKRSNLTYIFRRLRPVLVTKNVGKDQHKVLVALCIHPLGYYSTTWAGVMSPTDDVVAQLMMMRGDEHKFWAQSGQHPPSSVLAGLG